MKRFLTSGEKIIGVFFSESMTKYHKRFGIIGIIHFYLLGSLIVRCTLPSGYDSRTYVFNVLWFQHLPHMVSVPLQPTQLVKKQTWEPLLGAVLPGQTWKCGHHDHPWSYWIGLSPTQPSKLPCLGWGWGGGEGWRESLVCGRKEGSIRREERNQVWWMKYISLCHTLEIIFHLMNGAR